MTTTSPTDKTTVTCGKCDGRGRIDAFYHVAQGLCFWCKGTGQITITAKDSEPVQFLSVEAHGVTYYLDRRDSDWQVVGPTGTVTLWDDGDVDFTDSIPVDRQRRAAFAARRILAEVAGAGLSRERLLGSP